MATVKWVITANAHEDAEGTASVESGLAVSNKTELAIWLSDCTPGHLPQKNEKKCVLHEVITRTFTASILIIVQNWKQFKSPSMDELLNTMIYPYCGILLSNTEEQTIGIYNLVDRKMPSPQKNCMLSDLWNQWICYITWQRDFAGIKLQTLK